MMNLNLISDEQKIEINKSLIFNSIRNALYIFLLLLIMYAGVLLYLKNYFKLKVGNITNEIETINASSAIFKEKVGKINAYIDFTGQVQSGYSQYSCLIDDITQNDGGIYFDSIGMDIPASSLRIVGMADTRDDLIGYHAKLKKLEYLSLEELPLSILSTRNNLNFEISAVINPANIK